MRLISMFSRIVFLLPVVMFAMVIHSQSCGCSGDIGTIETDVEVLTVAGDGLIGDIDGVGVNARFNNPDGVTVTNSGTAYITDMGNHEIKKITEDGMTTTLAGNTTPGFVDGAGSEARFNTPDGITTDSSGNIFVADAGNNAIRKITPEGVVTTFAGNGEPGSSDGTGVAARFDFPTGITADSEDNLYVSDQNNNIVREITPAGVVTTIAGTGVAGFAEGTALSAQFDTPHGIAIDSGNNLYVTDQGNSRVRMISEDGQVSTVAGNGAAGDVNGAAAESQINTPHGVTVADTGEVYFADENNNKIKVVDATGVVGTLAGNGSASFADGEAASAAFNTPRGLTITQSGDFLVCDYTNQRVRKIIVDPNEIVTLAGNGEPGDDGGAGGQAEFSAPEAITVAPNGNAYVADTGNNMIRSVSEAGVTATLAGSNQAGFTDGYKTAARFDGPSGVVSDSVGNLYIADTGNNAVRKVTAEGVVTTIAGDGSPGNSDGNGNSAKMNAPAGLAIDDVGNIYVADEGNNSIRKITPAGDVTTVAGTGTAGFADGTTATAQFNAPKAVALDGAGNIYVADKENDRVRMISTTGLVVTVAGDGTEGFADGPAATSKVNNPEGIVIDAAGDVYLADSGNNKIRKIDKDTGKITTVAGTGAADDEDSSKAKKAKLNTPNGLALGFYGEVLIADKDNNKVKSLEARE